MGRLTDDRKADADAILARQKSALDDTPIKDGRVGEVNDLLSMQKARLNGMTPEEKLAAREEGMAGINQQLATNMKQFGDVAAGNGIRGGSAAGLQMQALGQAQQASGALSRQMILDNVAQKNIAMDRYGSTLSQQQGVGLGIQNANVAQKNIAMDRYGSTLQNQQGVGLGIQEKNNQSMNAESLARQLASKDYASQIDSEEASRKADALSNRGLDLTEQQLETLKAAGAPVPTPTPTGAAAPVPGAKNTESASTFNAQVNPEVAKKALAVNPAKYVNQDGTPMSPEQVIEASRNDPEFAIDLLFDSNKGVGGAGGKARGKYAQEYYRDVMGYTQEEANKVSGESIICTECFRQGFISEDDFEVALRYRKLMTISEYKGYISWAKYVVPHMQLNKAFAKRIAPFVRKMIQAERLALGDVSSISFSAHVVCAVVKTLNYSAAFIRSLRFRLINKLFA